MTVRTPLKLDGSDLREMTSTEITAIKTEAIRLYGASPSVTLSYVSSGGNLGTLNDTRLQAGAGVTDVTNFHTVGELGDVSTVTVGHAKISSSSATVAEWTDAAYSFPMYYDGSDLREMSVTDFYDTFIYPAIDTLTSGSTGTAQAGTYQVSTSNSVAGNTLMSASPIFTDTRANAGAYTAAGLIETQDQPTTITNFYLHRINSASTASFELPIIYTKSGTNLQQMPSATFATAFQQSMRRVAVSVVGSKISYNFNGAGNNRGSGITDTKLNSSVYLTNLVSTDDYRAQEVPGGTATTISTNYLKITQV